VRQLAVLGAAKVVCVDRDEYALYRLQLGLTGQAMLTDESMVLADVASTPQMAAVFAEHQPGLVFHAAACKQLPLLERAPAQAIVTNVHGTMNVATLAARYGASHFVNISTDKAARPVSVLGMTKRGAGEAGVMRWAFRTAAILAGLAAIVLRSHRRCPPAPGAWRSTCNSRRSTPPPGWPSRSAARR